MYNRTKWFDDTADFGTHMPPSLGSALYLSEKAGATLRKIGGELKVLLKF
jgi:hypothetical protein